MRRARLVAAVVVVAMGWGCLPKVPRQRLAERAKVAVAYVVDPDRAGESGAPPDALKRAVAAELDQRNLEAVEVPLDALGGQRLSDGRLQRLAQAGGGAPFLLLVEQKVTFFSQLDGRYRWEVGTTLSATRPGNPPARESFEQPVVLLYDHEREQAALAQSASDVAARAGTLVDALLAGAGPLPAADAGP